MRSVECAIRSKSVLAGGRHRRGPRSPREQQLGQIRAVLAGDAGNQGARGHAASDQASQTDQRTRMLRSAELLSAGSSRFRSRFGALFGRHADDGGQRVAFVEAHDPHALRVAADDADVGGGESAGSCRGRSSSSSSSSSSTRAMPTTGPLRSVVLMSRRPLPPRRCVR